MNSSNCTTWFKSGISPACLQITLLTALSLGFQAFGTAGCSDHHYPEVLIQTPLGKIVVEVYEDKAPATAVNFLSNVVDGTYKTAQFYRVVRPDNQLLDTVKIEVIQGGLFNDELISRYPVIPHETTRETGLRHTDGVLSMARNEPGSASTEFFICIGDQPSLDYGGKRNPDGEGFSAFGKVIRGMKVVRAIQELPDREQYLIEPVPILRMKVIR